MTLKTGNTGLEALIAQTKAQGGGALPVDTWHPEYCGEMDMVIRRDGSWWHDGTRITRASLVELFSRVLRKDEDGETYLVTPVEKIRIQVECAHFLITRMDVQGTKDGQRIFFTSNMDEVIELGTEHGLTVHTDPKSLEPTPLIHIRGRLEALLLRSVFYELVDYAVEREGKEGAQLGVYSGGLFFALGPAGIHNV